MTLEVRTYGSAGPTVILIHGGPGAPGTMAPLGRELADAFVLLEPLQRRSGEAPLTVEQHVRDMHAVVEGLGHGTRPALLGSSWGAMLALAYATEHPDRTGPLVLVGCGTFDARSRLRFQQLLEERSDGALRAALERLEFEVADPDERLARMAELLLPTYSHALVTTDQELLRCDARGHHETWDDMLRRIEAGDFPAAFAAIRVPVLMLHGAVDPHPGELIRDSLQPHVPQLEFRQWERCGHYPWWEREVREEFFATLRRWLAEACASVRGSPPAI